MIRILAILVFALAGLIRFAPGVMSEHGDCGHEICAPQVAEPSCCGELVATEAYCPMSGGPCRCSAAPLPNPQRAPDAPLPKTDRDSLTPVRAPPTTIETLAVLDPELPRGSAVSVSILAGLTHNEIQALLCIWRT